MVLTHSGRPERTRLGAVFLNESVGGPLTARVSSARVPRPSLAPRTGREVFPFRCFGLGNVLDANRRSKQPACHGDSCEFSHRGRLAARKWVDPSLNFEDTCEVTVDVPRVPDRAGPPERPRYATLCHQVATRPMILWISHLQWLLPRASILLSTQQKTRILRGINLLVPRVRIELTTQGFSVLRSTTELPRRMCQNAMMITIGFALVKKVKLVYSIGHMCASDRGV